MVVTSPVKKLERRRVKMTKIKKSCVMCGEIKVLPIGWESICRKCLNKIDKEFQKKEEKKLFKLLEMKKIILQ